ncbi:glutamine amidotransferase [Bifidobacterium aemilianum]|uniref:Lipid II isoglutaminyl synthase (glutamine-hydrolyzing) subunit GatD n=1 Tax=Bifidobacterium aemilianum TaxID=2493120 RepID=A0A366K831_9BIFI|nr:glutamine amidotransferase [Bifidobacterium aemilianum]RBP97895.1 glutamine amidotransferase [Bifidobacterium aemilianum]
MSQQDQSGKATADEVRGGAGRAIDILFLYPKDMNIYGDFGNLLTITRRLSLYGYEPLVHYCNQGDPWPGQVDMVLGGGGQDEGQKKIIDDLQDRAEGLRSLADQGVPMLVICGLYQLFGRYFQATDGTRMEGIGIFDAYTVGQDERMIGNLVEESDQFGSIIGYENHSGQTHLGTGTQPLGRVVHEGTGNNGKDLTEGARTQNVIGSYMHGSVLPKNPAVADFLIRTAAEHRHGSFSPLQTDAQRAELAHLAELAQQARKIAATRPR